jgi:predicted RNA-binding protein with PIN domain
MASPKLTALLFVDGYNIIGAWPELSQVRDEAGLEFARHKLTEVLVNYAADRVLEVRLVFDAYGQRSPVRVEQVTPHVSIHYTDFGQTADTYIEAWCARLRRHPQRMIVATSDRAQQLTVTGYGAEWMSAQQLSLDVSSHRQQRQQKQRQSRSHRRGHSQRFLSSSLSPEAQARLQQLRFGTR